MTRIPPQGRSRTDDLDNRLFSITDQFRRDGKRPDVLDIVEKARAEGVPVSHREVAHIARLVGLHEEILWPPYLPDFLIAALRSRRGSSLLDPWARTGSLLDLVACGIEAEDAIAIT